MSEKPHENLDVGIGGEIEVENGRALGHQLPALPVDAPGVQAGLAQAARETRAAGEDFDGEGAAGGLQEVAVAAEGP